MQVTHTKIQAVEADLEQLQQMYLQRWGWESTCNTPGSYWLWRRDFSDIDAKRKAWDDEHQAGKPGKPTPSRPMGMITAGTDLAISMTLRCHQVDYTKGACRPTEMVGACLSTDVLAICHEALAKAPSILTGTD